jgi:hypothetical protein
MFMEDNWKQLGMVPAWLWRLIYDRRYEQEEIDKALRVIIGSDYADVNGSVWIDRLEAAGNVDMIHSIEFDTPPVLDIIDDAIRKFLREQK